MTRLAAFLALLLAAGSALAGGPPRLSIERVAPGSREAKSGAAFVVRADQCGQPVGAPLLARAEGVVNGERRSVPLALVPTGTTGRYLVRRDWPSEGTWALVFSLDHHGHATLLVQPTASGELPSKLLDRPATAAEIDDRARAAAPKA